MMGKLGCKIVELTELAKTPNLRTLRLHFIAF
jgi:hypothetical protein